MIEIIPAILPHSYGQLEEQLNRLSGIAPRVHVDVVKDIFGTTEGLPLWDQFDFEFDIYIEPAEFVERALGLGVSSVVVHARHHTAREAMEALQESRGGDYPVGVGLALRPIDNAHEVAMFDGLFDFVQVMGISHEGHQGETFDLRAIELVQALHTAYPQLHIQVDGHAAGHEQALVAVGARALVVGSAIVDSDNPQASYKEIYTRANGSE